MAEATHLAGGPPVVEALRALPTPAVADAVVRLGLAVRQAPAAITGPPGATIAGRVLPVRHSGSVDVFLEALGSAVDGAVMVIDNGGRTDEACIGDLVAHEAHAAGVVGIVIWGLHRDAAEIQALGLPVFSCGTVPFGPARPRAELPDRLARADVGDTTVTREDVAVADSNGVVFLPAAHAAEVVEVATAIRDAEVEQVAALQQGTTLREQFGFGQYLTDRRHDPGRTFRDHLRERGRAIEE